MAAPSVKMDRCAVCGRTHPLEQHHIVKRSAGKMFKEGVEVKKPTVTLCGFGNNLKDGSGNDLCHGLAHANRLHFRWVETKQPAGRRFETFVKAGHLEYLLTEEPVKYQVALQMEGWKPLGS